MALFDQFRHETVQERQHQGINVSAVDIGIGHDDDLVVAQFGDIEIVVDSGSECRNHRFDLGIRINFIETCLLYVQNFSTQRQDCLRCTASCGFCGTTRGISLNQEDLTVFRILVGTVCQFSRQGHAIQCGFSSRQVTRFSCGLSGTLGKQGFFDNRLCNSRVLLQEQFELCAHDIIDSSSRLAVSEFLLRLALELRLLDFDADNRRHTLADVFSGQVRFAVF